MQIRRGKLIHRVFRVNNTETKERKVRSKAMLVDIRGNVKITERKFRKLSIINENLPQVSAMFSSSCYLNHQVDIFGLYLCIV